MERKEVYVRYKSQDENHWTGSISRELLTVRRIQEMRFQGYEFEEDLSKVPDLNIPKPPKRFKYKPLKKSELLPDFTYILCPDKKCGLFWYRLEVNTLPCERDCPKKDLEKKIVACPYCKDIIIIAGDDSTLRGVSHMHDDGSTPEIFRKRRYKIIYDMPE
jgi:hypothetical protein